MFSASCRRLSLRVMRGQQQHALRPSGRWQQPLLGNGLRTVARPQLLRNMVQVRSSKTLPRSIPAIQRAMAPRGKKALIQGLPLSRWKSSASLALQGDALTRNPAVAAWLFSCSAAVFGMVVVGGATRLTRSGLSMTDWRPQGRLPPMNEAEWEVEFTKYRNFPEYKRLNMNMSLDEFKSIYWWEWSHRMWGRGIGVIFALPLMYFAAKGAVPRPLYGRLGLLFGLGAAQGAIGWWMVRSGLEHTHLPGVPRNEHDTPRVSPYRLATHLSMAFGTYALLLWTGLDVLTGKRALKVSAEPLAAAAKRQLGKLRGSCAALTALAATTIVSGAFVAGNDAGRAYNDFPLMAGKIVPDEIWDSALGFRNFFENTATVQFQHRLLALSTFFGSLGIYMQAKSHNLFAALPPRVKVALYSVLGVATGQVTLGIAALVNYVPVELGVAHQAGALSLWTVLFWLLHSVRRIR